MKFCGIDLHLNNSIVVLALVLTLFGCATASDPPRGEGGDWRSFYVVNHGLHTGLVIARPDLLQVLPALAEEFSDGDLVEFGWGDEDFYRMQHGCRRPEQGSQGKAQGGLWGSVKILVTPAELNEVAVAEFFSQCGKHLK